MISGKWVVGGVVVAGISAMLIWAFVAGRAEQAVERERERTIPVPQRTSRDPAGRMVVTLDREAQSRIGLKVQALAAATLQPELIAPGTLQEDPSRAFTLRAPIGGTLRASTARDWPRLGAVLEDGDVVGAVEPRVAPVAQVDLESRLAAAKAETAAATASLAAARTAFERAKELNVAGKIVPDKAVEEAQARMKSEEARLAAANENVRLISASLKAVTGPTGPIPLRVARGGEVVEVVAQPGEAVESGQPILRVARFDTLVAKVDVPAGERVDPSVSTARIVVIGREDHPLRGTRIAQVASDPKSLGQTFLFRVNAGGLAVRPGQAVTAYLPRTGAPQTGVVIPRPAIVRFSGKTWAYVEIGEGTFSRREVVLEQPTEAGWFISSGVQAGARVVVAGAQVLLSEELKSRIQIESQ